MKWSHLISFIDVHIYNYIYIFIYDIYNWLFGAKQMQATEVMVSSAEWLHDLRVPRDHCVLARGSLPPWSMTCVLHVCHVKITYIPIGSMYAIYGNIYHQYTPNVSIYTIHGSYGIYSITFYASEIADFIRMWIYIFGDIANLEAWSTGMA